MLARLIEPGVACGSIRDKHSRLKIQPAQHQVIPGLIRTKRRRLLEVFNGQIATTRINRHLSNLGVDIRSHPVQISEPDKC
jgi:hypothetical protein